MGEFTPRSTTYLQTPIAIIGLACRLPGNCNSPEALWGFLKDGCIAQNGVPESRFNLKTHHDGSRKPKTMRSPGGMFLESVDPQDFDAQFFGIPRVEAIAMDPQQRQLLEVVYECLENAGIRLEALAGKPVGCFVGSYAVDYADMHNRDPEDRPPSVTVGVGRAILSNRISHFLDIRGPSFTIDTACSGSMVAVDVACRYLNTGEISEAIVAASNLYLSPEHNMDEGAMKGAASPSGKCHTFDAKADGYIKAEAVNAIILKRLEDAIRDGDPIRAVIRGTATNSDGRTPGIASPSKEAQTTAIRAAYAHAGIDVDDLRNHPCYVECHGTGTPAGDPIEVSALSAVFAESRSTEHPLLIGSIKSNIGHSEPAAGISGLLKAVLSLEKGFIPGNPTFVTPNPKIDFEKLKVRASRFTVPWPAVPIRRIGINSFGYGGSNAHVILDDANTFALQPSRPHVSSFTTDYDELFNDDETTQPFTLVFSANDEHSLKAYCKTICRHLINPGVIVKLPDLSYTLSERRSRLFCRAYVVVDKVNIDEGAFVFGKQSTEPPNVGFVFTGQGAQWPQMGKAIIETFPVAKSLIEHFDSVLQDLPNRPCWTLLEELVKPSPPDRLRIPEFSQPLTTALQLALLAVLESWGVFPKSVVGHSSGEIAAACAAGSLTPEEAIKIAFLRGQACVPNQTELTLGMLAVGLGSEEVQKYIGDANSMVQIGCFNSPSSVTLSGDRQLLAKIESQLQKDGHFARMLQVDFAYHSTFMADSAVSYEAMLLRDCGPPLEGCRKVDMFSSVTAKRLEVSCDAKYWTTNMTSPVRFDEAVREMVSGRESADFLVEIGPSGALAGPIKQILAALGERHSNINYCSALARGKGAIKSLFDVAGRLFLSGGSVDLSEVNKTHQLGSKTPSVIVDLPNYTWNHSTKHWYESEASKDWRFRKFPHHDLLGSKILGTSWNAPSWKKNLRVENLQWLKDHKMGPDIVFPAAGFIAMGIEALYQALQATDPIEEREFIDNYRYRLRNVTFPKALVLEEKGAGQKIMVTLAAQQNSWYEFKVSSLTADEVWIEHSCGHVCLEKDPKQAAPASVLAPLRHPVPGRLWYKAMHDAGYSFGPIFQKHLHIESLSGTRNSRSTVSLTEPVEAYKQSSYPLHPVCIDGCLQTVGPSLWNGNRSSISAVLIPAVIESLIVKPTASRTEIGISVTSSEYVGVGRMENTKNYMSNASVYDQDTGVLLFQVSGLRYHQLDVHEPQNSIHGYSQICWKPDITHLTSEKFSQLPIDTSNDTVDIKYTWPTRIHQLVDFIAHKKPNLKVLEINMVPGDQTSIWLDNTNCDEGSRAAYDNYHLDTIDVTTLISIQENYGSPRATSFEVFDPSRDPSGTNLNADGFDFVIIKMASCFERSSSVLSFSESGYATDDIVIEDSADIIAEEPATEDTIMDNINVTDASALALSEDRTGHSSPDHGGSGHNFTDLEPSQRRGKRIDDGLYVTSKGREERQTGLANILQNVHNQLSEGGYVLFIQNETSHILNGTHEVLNYPDLKDGHITNRLLNTHGFNSKIQFQCEKLSVHLAQAISEDTSSLPTTHRVDLIRLGISNGLTSKLSEDLVQQGWQVEEHTFPFSNLPPKGLVLILDELSSPLLANVLDHQWKAIKDLTTNESKILWVTTGSQFEVTKPNNALIHGLSRTIRAEDPLLQFMTLDTEASSGIESIRAIKNALRCLEKATSKILTESELVERNGVLYISRIRPDDDLNQAEKNERAGVELQVRNMHESDTCLRLRCERLGTLDSLVWAEVSDQELLLKDHMVEVEIFAAGLNFKDVAVTMGIVPENEQLPGLEGAGIIRRVGSSVSSLKTGQRVLVYEKGTFANRIQVTTERVYPLPDSMSFEDAATMPSVYLVAIYGLLRLANISKDQTVLIHSASGGVGIAAIQLCQHVGAKIFATVGNNKKREFLTSNFGIPAEHIFSSRTTAFASQIMSITAGKGIDVILNSLTGRILDESWRCVADGGTMIEIGKKDVLERNKLSMEPFNRNATYRGVDMSHRQISDPLIASLLAELMDLVAKGHVKPIAPVTVFPFEDIVSAFRYLRGGTHVGKVVISSGAKQNIELPVRPARRTLVLKADASYLIIGGLRGLCGSLAIYLARLGAKHLVMLCRSGYGDEKSQEVLNNISTERCSVQLFQGDVSIQEDVNRVFKLASFPIRGIIQGSMVLRDKVYTSMTSREFHEVITCKVKGTWNLHNASLAQPTPLDFFTLLSSISGVIGQKGQANYAAANMFLDSFASYRQGLGLPASSVDLGVVEDVGYVAAHTTELQAAFDKDIWTPINEPLLHQILRVSILQQVDKKHASDSCQLITGIAIPQPSSSPLLKRDIRFSSLNIPSSDHRVSGGSSNNINETPESKAIRAFLLSLHSAQTADHTALLSSITAILSTQFTNSLRLSEPMEPGKPLASYGLDSLSAVEFRNWVRMELGAELTTLDVMGAGSLWVLGEKILKGVRGVGVIASGKGED